MSKEERYKYHCDDYDYMEIVYDIKEDVEYNDMKIVTSILNQQDQQIAELKAENLSLQEQSIRDNQNWIAETTELQSQLAEKEKEQNQIAIGQLEEVKKFIFQKIKYRWNSIAELTCIDRAIIDGIYEQINKQIDELKGKWSEKEIKTKYKIGQYEKIKGNVVE